MFHFGLISKLRGSLLFKEWRTTLVQELLQMVLQFADEEYGSDRSIEEQNLTSREMSEIDEFMEVVFKTILTVKWILKFSRW